jgi:hypothetical protein
LESNIKCSSLQQGSTTVHNIEADTPLTSNQNWCHSLAYMAAPIEAWVFSETLNKIYVYCKIMRIQYHLFMNSDNHGVCLLVLCPSSMIKKEGLNGLIKFIIKKNRQCVPLCTTRKNHYINTDSTRFTEICIMKFCHHIHL